MELSAFKAPIDQRYFEDYNKGARFEYGPILVEEAEIISFARRFDPQTIHTDPEAAALGPFNGLIASGWHTMGLMMRLIVDHYLSAIASLGSPGVDEVRWLRPVRPNDQLRLRLSVLEANPSRSKPDRGLVVTLIEAVNQRDELVASFKAMNLLKRRSPASAPSS